MFGFFVLTAVASTPLVAAPVLPCDGIRQIEAASVERPTPFASLREMGTILAWERTQSGQRVHQQRSVVNVKAISGFERCRFVYSSQIDLACYIASTIDRDEENARAQRLAKVAENIGACLSNAALVRAPSEEGSTPSINFGGGREQPFWQISMVPTEEDPSRLQAEVLILGPAIVATPPRAVRPARPAPKAKRKSR
jgi:hypothetical protein